MLPPTAHSAIFRIAANVSYCVLQITAVSVGDTDVCRLLSTHHALNIAER